MEHILQFGINIDDDAIRNAIIKKSSEQVVKKIEYELGSQNWSYNSKVKSIIYDRIDKFLEQYKAEIIEYAGDKLAERLVRTKAVKEKTQEVLDSMLGDK